MKVSRQNIDESYSITCDWINDFARNIENISLAVFFYIGFFNAETVTIFCRV